MEETDKIKGELHNKLGLNNFLKEVCVMRVLKREARELLSEYGETNYSYSEMREKRMRQCF
jgi:hypothetical protein